MATTIVSTRPSGGNAQPASTQLSALSSVTTTGLYVITGPNAGTTLTITGTANEIAVINGSGVTGNPTISLVPDAVFPGNGAITVPSGTTIQQPGTPTDGMIRYNTSTNLFEFYQNGAWVGLGSGGSGSGTVTSVGLTSTDFTVTNSPITTSGNITANLAVQPSVVPGLYPNADIVVNSKGIITNISAGGTSTIKLYTENFASAVPNAVLGLNAFAIGEDNSVIGHNAVALGVSNASNALGSVALGNSAVANFPGQVAQASGKFQTIGDAQGSDYIYRGETGTQFPIEIFLDGVSARLVLTDNSAIAFEAMAVARRIDAIGDYGAFRLEGLIKRDSGTGSTAIVGQINKNIIARTNNNLDCNIQAYTPAGSLQVLVQGAASQVYNWVVRLISVEEIG